MLIPVMVGGAAVAWSLPALAPIVPPVCSALGIARRLDCDGVALTFDDGPHPEGTPAVLERLERGGVRGTFFLVGEQVERDPGLAREIVARGHAIGVHHFHHRNALRVPPGAAGRDLDRAADSIQRATEIVPHLHRPPYGILSPATMAAVARRGWTTWLWSRWGRDWRRSITPEGIAALVLEGLAPGDVVLLHDADTYSATGSHRRTAQALELILDELGARGLRTVTL